MSTQFPGGNLGGGGRGVGNLPRGTGFGGPRGTGALVSQVLVQFLTQYASGGVEKAAADLKALQAQALQARQAEQQSLQRVLALDKAVTEGQQARNQILNYSVSAYDTLNKLQTQALKEEKDTGAAAQSTVRARAAALASLEAQGTINERQVGLLTNQNSLVQQQAVAERTLINASAARLAAEEKVTTELSFQQQLAQFNARALTSLRNIAIAAIGATVGAALIYQPLQDLINGVGQALTDLVEPGQKAADALKDVAAQIDKLSKDTGLSNLEAARDLLKQLGADQGAAGTLSTAPDLKAGQTQADELSKIADFLLGQSQLQQQINDKERVSVLLIKAISSGQEDAANHFKSALDIINLIPGGLTTVINELGILGPVISLFDPQLGAAASHARDIFDGLAPLPSVLDDATTSASAFADALQKAAEQDISARFDAQVTGLEQTRDAAVAVAQAAEETALNRIRDSIQKAIDDISAAADAKIAGLEARIKAIGARGPSAQTLSLQDTINAETKAEADRRYQQQLSDLQEQKSLILLGQRLAMTKDAINLDDYSGKARLVAIDALLSRMQQQNEAQQRFNQLLDIQYQINQGVRRQQGETIQDFISRRAQYYRHLLEQAADLKQKGPEAELKAEKDRVQTTLELRDLEDRRTELIRNHAHEAYMKRLQDELKASQDADRKAAESEQQHLRDRITRIRADTQDRIKELNKTRDADIAATKSWYDNNVAAIKADYDNRIAGLKAQRDATKTWTDIANATQYAEATKGATSLAQLNAISGALAGANFSAAYVEAQLQALGIGPNDPEYALVIKNFNLMLSAYRNQFLKLSGGTGSYSPSDVWTSHAKGGIIPLENSLNLSRDVRVGEQGPEGGVYTGQGLFVLNNQIMSQLRDMDNRRAMFDGATFNIAGTDDPYHDRYALEQMIERVVRKTMN